MLRRESPRHDGEHSDFHVGAVTTEFPEAATAAGYTNVLSKGSTPGSDLVEPAYEAYDAPAP